MLKTVGERLRGIMQAKGVSARGLGRLLGTDRTTIGDYLKGTRSPSGAWIVSAAAALGARPEYLLAGSGAIWAATGEAGTVRAGVSARAPSCIPDAERERFGWLVGSVASDLRLPGAKAERVLLRLLTGTLATLRRERGEPQATPEELLEQLYQYRGAMVTGDFIRFGLMVADIAVQPGRVVAPQAAPKGPAERRGPRNSPRPREPG